MKDRIRISQRFVYPSGDFNPVPTEAFDIKIEGRTKHLKRALFWLLKRLGAVSLHWDREMLMTESVIDPEKISMEILARAQNEFMRMYPWNKPVTVYMGSRDLYDMLDRPKDPMMAAFEFPGQFQYRQEGQDHPKAFGMTVKVVPHMEGILVV